MSIDAGLYRPRSWGRICMSWPLLYEMTEEDTLGLTIGTKQIQDSWCNIALVRMHRVNRDT